MAIRALFLDFDGLICDTERAAWRSWHELYREFGLTFPDSVWSRMTGRADGESFAIADLSPRLGRPVSQELRDRRLRRKLELCAEEPPRPGVASLITLATGRGLTLAVVSGSPLAWVRGHLDRLELSGRFAFIVSGDDAARNKPAPDLYELALRRAGLAPTEVIAFEDSPAGVQAARAARLRCVAVPGAAGSSVGLDQADVILDSLERFVLAPDILSAEAAIRT